MSSILVTGGLGYIGSHTVVELQNSGYEVVVVDNLANSHSGVKDRIVQITGQDFPFYQMDVRNTEEIKKIAREHKVAGIIHFAADKAVGESVNKPSKYYLNNLGGLSSVLAILEEMPEINLVFSSSCTVYGETKDSPITEAHPLIEASSPYGTTKLIGEEILRDFTKHKNNKVIALRYFNPVGAHETGLIGELPKGIPSNLVPFVTQTAAGIREKLTVYGNDYSTPDGTCIRDYIHVVDIAKAHVKAVSFAKDNRFSYEVFNLGTGKGSSVLEVLMAFEKVNKIKVAYVMGERRAGDIEQIWAATKRSEEVLKWKAELSLEEMMSSAWKWQMSLGS